MSQLFRRISIILGLFVLAGAFFLSQRMAEKKVPPKKKETPVALEREVQVQAVRNEDIISKVEVQGSLEAFNKVDIFAEVTGTLSRNTRPLKVGSYFKKGAILLDVDRAEARLNILSQKSSLLNAITTLMPDLKIDYPRSFEQWKTYLDEYDVESPLAPFPKPLNEQEKYFIASKNLLSQYYAIKSAETRLEKYTVYAPFSGVITQSSINPGSLVRAGQKMGELMGTGVYEMKVTLNLENLQYIKPGSKVYLFSDAISDTWTGQVKRISDQIDPNTQSVIVYIGVPGKNLREGMYLRGHLNSQKIASALQIPLDLLINQQQVYIVSDNALKLATIEVLKTNAEHVIIRGLDDGTLLLNEKIIGAYEGLKVKPIELISSTE